MSPSGELISFRLLNRESELLLKHCDPLRRSDLLGVVVHGIGKIGKTSLVSWTLDRVLDRMRGNVAWVLVVGGLDRELLVKAMQLQDDLAHHLDGTDRPGDLLPTLRRCLERIDRPVVFVLDNLDTTMRSNESETLLTHEAAQTLAVLIEAVEQSGKNHRLVITSRYVPAVTGIDRLAHVELGALNEQYRRTKINRMQRARPIDPATVELVLEMSGGNTRLLEIQFATAQDNPDLSTDLLRGKLHTERERFVAADLRVQDLLKRQTADDVALLRALTPLRLAVGPAVLARLASPALRTEPKISSFDRDAAGKRAVRLAGWTLLDRTDTPDGTMLSGFPTYSSRWDPAPIPSPGPSTAPRRWPPSSGDSMISSTPANPMSRRSPSCSGWPPRAARGPRRPVRVRPRAN